MAGQTVTLLLDNSAWSHLGLGTLADARKAEIAEDFEAARIAVSMPFLLEAGYSARDAAGHSAMSEEFSALPYLEINDSIERRALDGQAQLARSGHHRLPPADLLLAAIAEQNLVGVLHYDADYDVIAAKTDLHFESVWLAPRGSL